MFVTGENFVNSVVYSVSVLKPKVIFLGTKTFCPLLKIAEKIGFEEVYPSLKDLLS